MNFYPEYIVCPTYVGMNRPDIDETAAFICMPHVCGDEPSAKLSDLFWLLYAPRMWG